VIAPYYESENVTLLNCDVLDGLREMADESVQCVVCSPPYWSLRDYGTATWEGGSAECDHKMPRSTNRQRPGDKSSTNKGSNPITWNICAKCGARRVDGQLGLEATPEEFVAKMVEVFREVRRVLRRDGTLWLNLGDSYNSTGGHTGVGPNAQCGNTVRLGTDRHRLAAAIPGLKPKDLCGIPWRVALALQADGWWLRSDIIWSKSNPMPESCTDRPTKSHEYVFLLTKSAKYFYDAEAIKEPVADSTIGRDPVDFGGAKGRNYHPEPTDPNYRTGIEQWGRTWDYKESCASGRNKRSVWTIPTSSYPEAHYAVYPPKLVEPCILAGSSAKGCCAECGAPWRRVVKKSRTFESGSGRAGHIPIGKHRHCQGGGETLDVRRGPCVLTGTLGWEPTCKHIDAAVVPCTVLDPFVGSGTTLLVAQKHGRRGIGIDLSETYLDMAVNRLGLGLVMDEAKEGEAQGALDYTGAGGGGSGGND